MQPKKKRTAGALLLFFPEKWYTRDKGGEAMEKRNTAGFVALELAIYLGFLLADAAGRYALGVALKYGGILLCAAYAWRGERRVALALTLTAAADLFLLVLGRFLELGVALFLAVQALYARRIAQDTRRTFGLRILLPLAAWTVLWRLDLFTPLNLLAAVYFPQLLCNMVLAWGKDRILALGLTLFIGCDVCVGLWNLFALAGTGMWAFYLPSQVLIALSGRKN